MRRRLLIAIAILVVLVAGGVAAYLVHRGHEAGNIRGSSTQEFVTTASPTVTKEKLTIPWPMFGLVGTRTRSVALALRPPFRRTWTYHAGSLVEFPPSIGYGRLYVSTNSGKFAAVEPEDRADGVEVPRASLRRRVAGDRPAAARLGLRRVPQQAAVQRADRRPRHRRQGDRLRRRLREDPLDEDDRPVGDVAAPRRQASLRRRLERQRVEPRRAHREDDLALPHRRRGEGRRRDRGQPALRRLVRRPRLLPLARTARRSGSRRPSRGSTEARRSTRRRRSRTGASTSARPTARSTRSARRAGSCAGRTAPAATSTHRRPSRAGSSTPAPSAAASSRSTRRRET